jgi:opacity protein-like surface antigen
MIDTVTEVCMLSSRAAAIAAAMIALTAAPALADATAFLGASTAPVNRLTRGLAIGVGIMLGLEFEYANTVEDVEEQAPALRTGMTNAILQTPFGIGGVQPYLTGGLGLHREELNGNRRTGLALNVGGGVKVSLAGPLRVRVDYRVLRLRGGARHTPVHRVYAGLNLAF